MSDEKGVIGWAFVVVLVLVFLVAMSFVKCLIPGDGEDNGPKEDTTTTEQPLPGDRRP